MAYLSDDLPAADHARVEGHLALCWACNQRYLALREKMQRIREALHEESVLGPQHIARARREFFVRYAALESELAAEKVPAFRTFGRAWNAAFAARLSIAASVCLVGLIAWLAFRAPQVQPRDVLAQTLEREDGLRLLGGPVHQEFQIDIQQIKPAPQRRSGLLSVWYDSRGERFAGRWEGDGGRLQYAIWRPEPNQEFVFNAQLGAAVARAPQAGQPITLGELSFEEASLEQLETGFLYWLSNRRWEPISIASDVNLFRLRDGVEAEVELVNSGDGRQAYRITARRETDWGTVEVVAEVDAQTYKPNIELLRLSTADRVVELRLRSCRTQWLVSGMVEQAVFWPSVSIAGEQETLAGVLPEAPRRPREVPETQGLSAAPTAAELDLLEVQARYALHQAGACLGVPVRVERVEGRLVRVEGLVESAERKGELLTHLAELSLSPLVDIDIKTVEEALQTASASGPTREPTGSPARGNATRGADERLEVVATDSPIREALERYLRQTPGAAVAQNGSREAPAPQELASEFSDRVLSNSLANLTEAWALRRLAERYGGAGRTELAPPAAALLRRMLADHNAGLRARTAAIQGQVRPLLLSLVENGRAAAPPAAMGRGAAPDNPGEQDWAAQSLRIFQEIESTEAATTGLFADSGFANGGRREATSEHAVAALLQALPRLENRLRSLEQYLNEKDGKSPPSRASRRGPLVTGSAVKNDRE
jgi:hypothetical protein